MVTDDVFQCLLGDGILPIGLGCSRLGSVNGASESETRKLLELALCQGFRFFDTANIYAQGDSERLLGQALGKREDCLVCSKAGKYTPWLRRGLVPFKRILRGLARRSTQTRRSVAAVRSRPMPTCWDAFFLEKSIDASLRRLNRPRIEVFMLHSPTVDVMNRGKAMDTLERVRQKGKIGIVGVAVDDVATAEAALKDARVRVMQLPMLPGDDSFDAVVGLAAQNGVAVVAREILGGGRAISGAVDPACYAEKRITELVRMPEITVPLVGTTREAHLVVAANAARAAMGASR